MTLSSSEMHMARNPRHRPTKALYDDMQEAGLHASIVVKEWDRLSTHIEGTTPVYIDSQKLDIAHVVAVSAHGAHVDLKNLGKSTSRIDRSVDFLAKRLDSGRSLYGVTTGFGGSADLYTDDTNALQQALVQHQQSGILPVVKQAKTIHARLKHSAGTDFMPETWVRGAILVRCKSLLAAHSAVRMDIVELLMALLNHDMTPLVPLRGSISASGDLQPLSYIAGVLEGNPDCYVWTGDNEGCRKLIPANVALDTIGRKVITFGPKEALAILNGTAVSTSVAALALHEAHHLGVFTQVLTAMGVEALSGSIGSFNEFFSKVRPHKGQAEAARNIRRFLVSSQLVRGEEENEENQGLKQDRYALRTSPQWIGPQLEDLALAHEQVTVECNSTTDNPLVDIEGDTIHHGGNFQAVSVTSAMEKTRRSLQMFGRMLFSQCTELINPAMNSGLPPNLAADEPSTSYTMKGADINIAAYTSELGFLANPVSSHVQTAEMGNQAINSLALISARYTHTAVDLLSMICATYLYVLCQALDIRAMNLHFLNTIEPAFRAINTKIWGNVLNDSHKLEDLQTTLKKQLLKQFPLTTSLDSAHRFQLIVTTIQPTLTTFIYTHATLPKGFDILTIIHDWNIETSQTLLNLFIDNRNAYFAKSDASPYLGAASSRLYSFVRRDLKVPFHKGLIDRPQNGKEEKIIGSNISIIHDSMRSGGLHKVVLGCLRSDSRADRVGERSEFGDVTAKL